MTNRISKPLLIGLAIASMTTGVATVAAATVPEPNAPIQQSAETLRGMEAFKHAVFHNKTNIDLEFTKFEYDRQQQDWVDSGSITVNREQSGDLGAILNFGSREKHAYVNVRAAAVPNKPVVVQLMDIAEDTSAFAPNHYAATAVDFASGNSHRFSTGEDQTDSARLTPTLEVNWHPYTRWENEYVRCFDFDIVGRLTPPPLKLAVNGPDRDKVRLSVTGTDGVTYATDASGQGQAELNLGDNPVSVQVSLPPDGPRSDTPSTLDVRYDTQRKATVVTWAGQAIDIRTGQTKDLGNGLAIAKTSDHDSGESFLLSYTSS